MSTLVQQSGMSVIGTGKSCKTCGHRAHCGTPAYMNFKDYSSDGGGVREVKVCDCCSCEDCTNKRKEEIKKGSN